MSCKVFKIGVFFDGTGNNTIFDRSNGRDQQSNIGKLHLLYKIGKFECEKECKVTAYKVYIDGIGTYDTQEEHDSHPIKRKYDKGGGGGGAKRINEAIDKVTTYLDNHQYGDKKSQYKTRLIDVFGFSRGAALARDFVNTFYEDKVKILKQYKDVRFNFIGLYDTVASFGEPGNDDDYKVRDEFLGKKGADEAYLPKGMQLRDDNFGIRDPKKGEEMRFTLAYVMGAEEAKNQANMYKLKGWKRVEVKSMDKDLYEIIGVKNALDVFELYNFNLCMQSSKKIIHFTGHDEVRKNFPLTDINGSGGQSCAMMGVHSDVGGGYAPEKMERHKFHQIVKPNYFYDANFLIKRAAFEHAKKLNGLGGTWSVEVAASSYYGKGVYILQRKVLNDLSNVTLHLMYEQASSNNVAFNDMPKNDNYAILPSLAKYYTHAKEYSTTAYTYAKTKDGQLLDATQRHHSSADPANISTHYVGNTDLYGDKWKKDSADDGGNDARYVDKHGKQIDGRKKPEDAVMVKRAIFPNNPDDAVKPT